MQYKGSLGKQTSARKISDYKIGIKEVREN